MRGYRGAPCRRMGFLARPVLFLQLLCYGTAREGHPPTGSRAIACRAMDGPQQRPLVARVLPQLPDHDPAQFFVDREVRLATDRFQAVEVNSIDLVARPAVKRHSQANLAGRNAGLDESLDGRDAIVVG